MRNPPARTSSPLMRFDALGSCALRSYVGTNGRPLFALYARNTLTVATRIVTAPTRTGLATTEVAPRPLTPAEGRAFGGRVRRLRGSEDALDQNRPVVARFGATACARGTETPRASHASSRAASGRSSRCRC